jgi:hypothetical protein
MSAVTFQPRAVAPFRRRVVFFIRDSPYRIPYAASEWLLRSTDAVTLPEESSTTPLQASHTPMRGGKGGGGAAHCQHEWPVSAEWSPLRRRGSQLALVEIS